MKSNDLIRLTNNCYWSVQTESLFVDGEDAKLSVSQKKLFKFLVKNINKPVLNLDILYELNDSQERESSMKKAYVTL